jgi:hypothetical protein
MFLRVADRRDCAAAATAFIGASMAGLLAGSILAG